MKKNKARNITSAMIKRTLEQIDPTEAHQIRNRMELAVAIDNAIKAKGISKVELANKLNKSPSEITKWLSGTHNFTIDTLSMLEMALSVNLLFKGVNEKETVVATG